MKMLEIVAVALAVIAVIQTLWLERVTKERDRFAALLLSYMSLEDMKKEGIEIKVEDTNEEE